MILSLLGAWCVGKSPELDQTYMSKSCLIRVVRFTKIQCHDLNRLNAPKSVPRHDYCGFKWVRSIITSMTSKNLPNFMVKFSNS